MARRPLPKSEVISSVAKEPKLPKKGETRDANPHKIADELNAQHKPYTRIDPK